MNQSKKSNKQDKENNKFIPQADEKNLQSTDPQEYMKGPFSSVAHMVSEEVKKNDKVSKEEATQRRDENL
ncbi:MAG: hypothetical protein JJE22_15220 [Bacteroidia bacterium]|nr:hypothetical protein [Bacteroidia bacterium]